MKNIYFRNFVITLVLVLFSFLAFGLAFMFLGRAHVMDDRRETMHSNAEELVHYVGAFTQSDSLDSWDLGIMISSIAHITGNQIFLCDDTGTVISCSCMEVPCAHVGKQISESVISTITKSGSLDSFTDLGGFYRSPCYVVALPVTADTTGQTLGFLFVSADMASLMRLWNNLLLIFFIMLAIVLCLMLLVSYSNSHHQIRPLNDMAAAASKFAHGDFSARVRDEGRDDAIGQLTTAFNDMAESLEKSEDLRREFISNVSHELKTPMTSIAGFADGLLDGTIPKEQADHYLTIISSETKRLNRMVRRMLDLSRLQAEDPGQLLKMQFDVSELLRRTLLSLIGKIEAKQLDVDTQIPEEPIIARGSEDMINQVVFNLLDNAIKFAKPGTQLGLSLWKQGNKAYVSVKDTGEGIPADDLPFIFDRFHKSDRSRSLDREGVGLGLHIVKTILNRHNEDITVTSMNNVVEFVFSLTLVPTKKS